MSKVTKDKETLFQLNAGTSDTSSNTPTNFVKRSRDVFAGIDDLGKLKPGSSLLQETTKFSDTRDSSVPSTVKTLKETEHYRNRESIFKLSEHEESGWPPAREEKPVARKWERGRDQDSDFRSRPRQTFKRPFQRQSVPDHVKDPKKYTKYNLSDVPGVTDHSNAQAAFSFLREQQEKERVEDAKKAEANSDSKNKVVFRKPIDGKGPRKKVDSSTNMEIVNVSCGNSKRILPEVEVGKDLVKNTIKRQFKLERNITSDDSEKPLEVNNDKSKLQTKLSHLTYEEEDDC